MTNQFKEYLQYQPFLVQTDNNPLTYIMTMPNLDAVGNRWVVAMAGYNFKIEYVRGSDNKVTDALSQVGEQLDENAVKELLDQGVIKELLTHAVHALVFCERRPTTPESPKNMKGQRVRSSCRRKC